jgi:hypothetical protein
MNIAQATTIGTSIGRRVESDFAIGLFQRNNDKDVSGAEARITYSDAGFIYPLFPEKG